MIFTFTGLSDAIILRQENDMSGKQAALVKAKRHKNQMSSACPIG
jgi:hypothetical protein